MIAPGSACTDSPFPRVKNLPFYNRTVTVNSVIPSFVMVHKLDTIGMDIHLITNNVVKEVEGLNEADDVGIAGT